MYKDNCFLTLTYDDDHLPADRSVSKREMQLFMKRLRERTGAKVKYLLCGEYGESNNRPHYHVLLFGYDFSDKVLFKKTDKGPYYVSPLLADLWPFGYSIIGALTFDTAAYVSRYVMKKVTGDAAEDHYWFEDEHGVSHKVSPEFQLQSVGLGRAWLEKFGGDVYPDDFVVMRGRKMRPPRYYDKIFSEEDAFRFRQIKAKRRAAGREHADNNTPARLKVREKVAERKQQQVSRKYERDDL